MSILKNNVVLRYVSASDTSNDSSLDYGASRYEITFDQSVVTLGNVIMFEYKIQDISSNMNSNFDNSTFGFIAVENATVSGISNQFILSVPASQNVLNDVATQTIQFRVYAGQKGTERVVITDWSNSLNLYNPPATPVLEAAYFDPSGNEPTQNDDLYVFFDVSQNPTYDYNAIKFVVCYFYQDASTNDTVWNISDPIASIPVTIGGVAKRMIDVPNIGEVTLNSPNNKVYVTAHSVYNWSDICNNSIYALSYVSNEVVAISGSTDNKPDITDICYNVYSFAGTEPAVPGNQSIRVQWNAPGNSGIPYYELDHYELEYSINGGAWTQYGPNVPVAGPLDVTVDISPSGLNMVCGQDIKFRVNAETKRGDNQYSADSTVVNFFRYSTAPQELVITNTSFASGKVGMTVNFKNPSDKGCGAGEQFVVLINGQEYSGVGSLVYDAIASAYSIVYSDLSINQVGDVKVYLRTQDTNSVPGGLKLGQSTTVPYIANNLVLDPLSYRVYSTPSEQIMDLVWDMPSLAGWSVEYYEVRKNGVFDASFANTVNAYAYEVKEEELEMQTNLEFQVIAHMKNGDTQYDILSNKHNLNTFAYSSAPQELVITETSLASGLVGMTVNFKNPSDKGLGDGLQYVVKIDGQVHAATSGSLVYDASASAYAIVYSDLSINQIGFVEVYLETRDTNSSDVMNGASATTPYIANNVVLSDILYQVYDNANNAQQDMLMGWNNPALGSGSKQWLVKEFQVQLKKDNDSWNIISDASFISTSYIYNAINDIASVTNLQFRIKAVMTHVNTGVEYVLTSNEKSQKTFTYAETPTALVISDVTLADGKVGMTVSFNAPLYKGLGTPQEYIVNIDGQDHVVPHTSDASFSIEYSDLSINQVGDVTVYLKTQDTNSADNMNGASITVPYIANNLVLDPLSYRVYNANSEQVMDLSWSNPALLGWNVVKYEVQKKLNSASDASYAKVADVESRAYAYNLLLEEYQANAQLHFRVIAHMQNAATNYAIVSNSANLNSFTYSLAPQNLLITDISYNASADTVNMTVNFNKPSNIGLGAGVRYVIEIGTVTKYENYVDQASYSYTYTGLSISQDGMVKVYLQTQDTNAPNANMNGASVETPYIANIVTLAPVDYDVYLYGNTDQDMKLSWSNPAYSGWDVKYKVQKFVGVGPVDVVTELTDALYTYDATADATSVNTMKFRVIATLTKSGVSYDIISNEQSKNTFKYADAPKNAIVNWAVANSSKSYMDVNVTFENPDFLGVNNGRVEYKVELLDNSNGSLAPAQIKSFNPFNPVYHVNFDEATYAASGKVKISLYVTDTNSLDNITFYKSEPVFISDVLPLFVDVSYDIVNNTISGKIISHTELKPIGQVVYPMIVSGNLSQMYAKEFNMDGSTIGMSISNEIGLNGEYIYTFELAVSTFLPASPPGLAILAANNVGVGQYRQKF